MKVVRALLLIIIPVAAVAHPGGGLIALDANTVIFGDSMYNAVWRLEKGKKSRALVENFHAHWTTRGLDGQIYSESFQEMGGALFRIDLAGGKSVKVADKSDLNAPVFAVGKSGELIFLRGAQIMERSADGTVKRFRGFGEVAQGEPPFQQVIAYHWAADETLYLSDGNHLRRIGNDGVVRLVARVDGKLIEQRSGTRPMKSQPVGMRSSGSSSVGARLSRPPHSASFRPAYSRPLKLAFHLIPSCADEDGRAPTEEHPANNVHCIPTRSPTKLPKTIRRANA